MNPNQLRFALQCVDEDVNGDGFQVNIGFVAGGYWTNYIVQLLDEGASPVLRVISHRGEVSYVDPASIAFIRRSGQI